MVNYTFEKAHYIVENENWCYLNLGFANFGKNRKNQKMLTSEKLVFLNNSSLANGINTKYGPKLKIINRNIIA